MRPVYLIVVTILLVAIPSTGVVMAQDWDPSRIKGSREGLQELLYRFENVGQSQAYSEALRAEARAQAAAIRQRLEHGDFHVGDRVVVSVRGDSQLSDTFVVASGQILDLPWVGEVSLRGVLRSELETHLKEYIGRFVRDPVVRTNALIRISLQGEFNQPGFYTFLVDMPLADAIMSVGGVTSAADFAKLSVVRGGERVRAGELLQVAIGEGQTLEQLNLRTGDQIFIGGGGFRLADATRFVLIGLPAIIFGLQRILQ